MLHDEVLEKALYVSECSLSDFVYENGIDINASNSISEEACLMLGNGKASILLRDDLDENRAAYAILHEIGHYVLDVEDGEYSFTLTHNRNRSEFKANLFACFCILKNIDLNGLNIIQWLICNGCPESIAVRVFDYMKQNMSKEDMMKFCEV